ncbi:glycoside hydrolase family 16 protein [Roseimarinus sediminis]|uniref:glycoside hydrolase family 16 protein n=1 Tax=Roseimarinus sediminis TaxID=1610899 RepID=UPI003D2337F2
MARLKDTETIEQQYEKLWRDYQLYLQVEKSEKLKRYLSLKEKVESKPFQKTKDEIEALRFKGSPEEKLLKQYQKLNKNRKIKLYFQVLAGADLSRFQSIQKQGLVEEFKELEQYVKRGTFKAAKKAFKQRKKRDKEFAESWEQSDAFAKKSKYESLRKSDDLIFMHRFQRSRAYQNYLRMDDSYLLNQYNDLKEEIESEKFKERKAYLEDATRYEKTDDFKELSEFKTLEADQEIQLYLNYNDTDDFKFFREWELTFEEQFESFDPIWSFVSPVASKGPGRNFSMNDQLHYANYDDNFDLENGILTLETKQESVDGLYWDEQFGFVPRRFSYATGLLHSLKGFQQEYGHFEVKVKASKIKGVISSVSLVDEDETTCIRIYTAQANAVQGGVVVTDQLSKSFDPVKLKTPSKGYMIVALTWTPEKLEWSVNNKVMGSTTSYIPHTPLGLRIETEVIKETGNLPHRLDIDWIRCFRKR